jgi:hypothetical protein
MRLKSQMIKRRLITKIDTEDLLRMQCCFSIGENEREIDIMSDYMNIGLKLMNGTLFKSKRAAKEAIDKAPETVRVFSTGLLGRSFDGPASEFPEGLNGSVVGPDPYTERKWYGNLIRSQKGLKLT